jgi:MFS family permease
MINLWNPAHVSLGIDLLTALLLGMVHGITPDEHTWPITFSYAIGGYSTRRGMVAGLTFSLAFTVQRALASELAYLGFSRFLTHALSDYLIYIVVGTVMALAGLTIIRRGKPGHLHIPGLHSPTTEETLRDPRPWMPALHGFIAGWGFGAFALIILTVLAPGMPNAALGWAPGAVFGLGTTIMQMLIGAAFGLWMTRRGLGAQEVRRAALVTASRTLTWGGLAFILAGMFGLAFPRLANLSFDTGLHVHNLDSIGLPFLLVILVVAGIGVTSLVRETRSVRSS